MAKFLDDTGLAYFWQKIKNLVLTKSGTQFTSGNKVLSNGSGIWHASAPEFIFYRSDTSTAQTEKLGEIWANTKAINSKRVLSQLRFRQISNNTNGDATNYYEDYLLPGVNDNRTESADYSILTSKTPVTIEQGGTNATNAWDACTNIGAPHTNVSGRIWRSGGNAINQFAIHAVVANSQSPHDGDELALIVGSTGISVYNVTDQSTVCNLPEYKFVKKTYSGSVTLASGARQDVTIPVAESNYTPLGVVQYDAANMYACCVYRMYINGSNAVFGIKNVSGASVTLSNIWIMVMYQKTS